jgi:hypothetical protein
VSGEPETAGGRLRRSVAGAVTARLGYGHDHVAPRGSVGYRAFKQRDRLLSYRAIKPSGPLFGHFLLPASSDKLISTSPRAFWMRGLNLFASQAMFGHRLEILNII